MKAIILGLTLFSSLAMARSPEIYGTLVVSEVACQQIAEPNYDVEKPTYKIGDEILVTKTGLDAAYTQITPMYFGQSILMTKSNGSCPKGDWLNLRFDLKFN